MNGYYVTDDSILLCELCAADYIDLEETTPAHDCTCACCGEEVA